MTPDYTPEPGHQVVVRRYEVPCPELPSARRRLLIEIEGTVAAVRHLAGGVLLRLEGSDEPIFSGYQFSGQDQGVSWSLVTEVTRRVWVSTTSHRSRERLVRLVGEAEAGPSFGIWPEHGHPHGSYYQVPDSPELRRIRGLRVLRAEPKGGRLFKRWTSREMGGPEPGNWPVPAS